MTCALAIRHPAFRQYTTNLINSKISKCRSKVDKRLIDPLRKKHYQRIEKRWSKLLKMSQDETKTFALGFSLGLIANETILMPPQLLIAYPLTPIFKYFIHKWEWGDDKLHRISDWGLESVRNEIHRRKN
jgi:hypothetical protein